MSNTLAATDLAALFDIEMADGVATEVAIAQTLCGKCHGKGRFIGYTGRVIGPCFTCNGTGLAHTDGRILQPGDCTKCAGSGEWRPGKPCFACSGSGKEQVAANINVDAIATAFAHARSKGVKAPKLRLDGFVFSRAPDHGANAGAIYVKADGQYLGKVADGQFRATMACDAPTKARVIEAAADPHKAAKAYGAKTGQCSVCGRELTAAQSVADMIGPICREKFGW